MTDFYPSATMEDFMLSDKYVRVLGGPIGGGKSVCCAHTLMNWASMQAPNAEGIRKTRFLIVRNTADQLMSTTLKTIIDWFPPEVYGKKVGKTLFYTLRLPDNTIVQTEWMLIALDTPDDVRKALSLECTGLWGNESRELHPDVVDGLLMRVNRYPSKKDGGVTRPGAIFDTNMPEEDSWWEQQMETPPKNWGIFKQPPGVLPVNQWIEKYKKDPPPDMVFSSLKGIEYAVDPAHDNYENLAKDYYVNTGEGKKDSFIKVYLRTQYGVATGGKPIYEETFIADRHVAHGLIALISDNFPLCIGLDFGRQPAAVVFQATPAGFVHCLGEVVAENMGMRKFILTKFRPYMQEHFPRNSFYIAPDPAGFQATQLGEESPAGWLIRQGFELVRPASNLTEPRVTAMEDLLSASVDSRPRFRIDPVRAPLFYQGLNGKYRWKTDKNGDLMATKEPVKNKWSHPGEAGQYAAMVIDGTAAVGRRSRRKAKTVQRRSAAGWT